MRLTLSMWSHYVTLEKLLKMSVEVIKTLLKEQQKQQQTMMQGLIKNESNDSFLLIDMSLNIGGG